MDFDEQGKIYLENRKNKFAIRERQLYSKILEYLESNYPVLLKKFKVPFDLKNEKKIENDIEYKKAQDIIKKFYSKIFEFKNDVSIHKNNIAYNFSQIIYIYISKYRKEKIDEKIKFYEDNIKKECNTESGEYDVKRPFERTLEQFIIFLKMFINLKDEEIISVLENQPFKDIKREDTIKLLRKRFPNQITKKCPQSEIGFNTSNDNFTVD